MTRIITIYFIYFIAVTFHVTAFAAPDSKRLVRTRPKIALPSHANGERAIQVLGDKLPALAAWYGKTTSEFAKLLQSDPRAWLDKKGHLFFIDEIAESAGEILKNSLMITPFPLSDTFTLNSRPGANRVIYLDFDGHITTGTAWNISYGIDPIISPSYNSEGNSFTFTDTELAHIQRMWQQVSEDFAPFNINVTTEDPGQDAITRSSSTDQDYGIRVVITEDFKGCDCGGFSYVGIFDYIGDKYKPAFVFNRGQPGSGKAISHESGHNLGLSHDGEVGESAYYQGHGEGATGWAPIMGAVYYKQLVQWSKGEYSGANETEDDIAKIQDYGASLVADDHSDVEAGATPLDTASNDSEVTISISGAGIIEKKEDIDVFSIVSGSGNYAIIIDPAPLSPNLDILAQLYDDSGYLVASANPSNSLQAILSGTGLATGQYFLKIDGVGNGDPLRTGYSDYGSLGRYTISGTIAAPREYQAPVAKASAYYTPGYAPLTVTFDATGSTDPYGYIASFEWDLGDGNNNFGETLTHVYTTPGDYTATLTVTDNDGISRSDSVSINIENQAPIAIASADTIAGGAPFTVEEGTLVTLDASASKDPDGDNIQFEWAQSAGIHVTLTKQASATPSFIAPDVNSTSTLSFVVRVSDGHLASTNKVDITVNDLSLSRSSSSFGGSLYYLAAALACVVVRKLYQSR